MSTFRRHDTIKSSSLIPEQKVIALSLSAKKSQPSIGNPHAKNVRPFNQRSALQQTAFFTQTV